MDEPSGCHCAIAADAIEALRREREPVEPVAWQYRWKIDGEYVGWRFSDHSNAHPLLDGFEEIPLYTTPPDALALVAAAYRDAGAMFTIPEAKHHVVDYILARTPADAQAALAAIERAAYERGVRDAADAVPVEQYHESWMARMLVCARVRILALLTQEGR